MNAADPHLRCFLDIPSDSDFPLQNLPYGVFSPRAGEPPRVGVAIGDQILDLSVLEAERLLTCPGREQQAVFATPALNAFLSAGPTAWRAVRARLTELLSRDTPTLRDGAPLRRRALCPQAAAQMHLPAMVGDYTDFYAGIHHATNVGRIFRGPDAALMPNYRWIPIGYHGRSSSIVVSGAEVRRPRGQYKPADAPAPLFGPSRELDIELEMGALIGVGNPLGEPIPAAQAAEHIFGLVLLNDWSARDIQQWEYQPLGPFLGKNFATTISPWVVTLDALAPFRCPQPPQEPPPLEYLRTTGLHSYDIALEVQLGPAGGALTTISRTNFRELYWSLAQMVAHHTVNGCNLRPGDLLGTGTISGPAPGAFGSLLELAQRGKTPVKLADGAERVFLHDGDTVTLRGACHGPGYRVGFGECRGTIRPAKGG
jgi:fumarylacetoacetase